MPYRRRFRPTRFKRRRPIRSRRFRRKIPVKKRLGRKSAANLKSAAFVRTVPISSNISSFGTGAYRSEMLLKPSEVMTAAITATPLNLSYQKVRLRGYKVTFYGVPAVTTQTAVAIQSIGVDLVGTPVLPNGSADPRGTSTRVTSRTYPGYKTVSAYHNTLKALRQKDSPEWLSLNAGALVANYPADIGGILHMYYSGLANGNTPIVNELANDHKLYGYVTFWLEFSGIRTKLGTEPDV